MSTYGAVMESDLQQIKKWVDAYLFTYYLFTTYLRVESSLKISGTTRSTSLSEAK